MRAHEEHYACRTGSRTRSREREQRALQDRRHKRCLIQREVEAPEFGAETAMFACMFF